MVLDLDHIAIRLSSEKNIDFYKKLGFRERRRLQRERDLMIVMDGFGKTLEFFISDKFVEREKDNALGLTHIAIRTEDLLQTMEVLGIDDPESIKEAEGIRYAFITDPDGLLIVERHFLSLFADKLILDR